MKILKQIETLISQTPEWVVLFLLPALLAIAAIAFIFFRRRAGFYPLAIALGAFGTLAVFLRDKSFCVLYACAFTVLTGLASLVFFIPCRRSRERVPKRTHEEKMYEKFHEELSEKPYTPRAKSPAKVCCFEERCGYEETNDMRLSYAETLLKKLRAQKLNAGDRLETEELARRLCNYQKGTLTEEERDTLNDCLASVLKLTAKYEL